MEYDIETYIDADYAHKVEDRRSVSGVAVCCGGTLVSWFSRTQKCVTLSTTEAEYVAMADGVKEALYVRGVLVFLCIVRDRRVLECMKITRERLTWRKTR